MKLQVQVASSCRATARCQFPELSPCDPLAFASKGPCPHFLSICSLCHCLLNLSNLPLTQFTSTVMTAFVR